MKEFEPKNDTRIEMSVKQKKEVKHELVDNLVPHEGHTVWKINKETLEIEPAKYTNATYNLTGDNKREILIQPGYAYVAALNKKNALKKYQKGLMGGKVMGNEKFPY